jgi:hypothetical protein
MTRYQRDFAGIRGAGEARGMDPNFRNGYGGMRMGGGNGRAPYGAYRWDRARDLETWGGFEGWGPDGRGRGGAGRGRPEFHPDVEQRGGLRSPYGDERILREFNTRSPELSRNRGRTRYGGEMEPRERGPVDRPWSPQRDFRPEYSNRGVTDAGYSEGWARGPMPGAR